MLQKMLFGSDICVMSGFKPGMPVTQKKKSNVELNLLPEMSSLV